MSGGYMSTSAITKKVGNTVDAMGAYYSNDGSENYACPNVTELQDFMGRKLDTPFQYWGYGDQQRNIGCIPNELVVEMKDQQRAFALMNAPQPAAIRQKDGTIKTIGGGFYGIPIGDPYHDYLSGRGRNFSIPSDRPIYSVNTPARPGVDPMHAWMDTRGKLVQQKSAAVDFFSLPAGYPLQNL